MKYFCVYNISALCIQSFVLIFSYDASSTIKSKKSKLRELNSKSTKTSVPWARIKHLLKVYFNGSIWIGHDILCIKGTDRLYKIIVELSVQCCGKLLSDSFWKICKSWVWAQSRSSKLYHLIRLLYNFYFILCRRYLVILKKPILKAYPPKSTILNVEFALKLRIYRS